MESTSFASMLTNIVVAQLEADVQNAKQAIETLREAVAAAKQKQQQAKDDIKKLERDMDEFKNNKEGKIEELKVALPIIFRPIVFSRSVAHIERYL